MAPSLPPEFIDTVLRIFGVAGQAWLDRLPQLLIRCSERWQLTLGEPVPGLSINYVAFAVTPAGDEVVLKVGVPHREMETEIEALQHYGGNGIVKCLAADLQHGAMLLERLRPGWMLTREGNNVRETQIAAGLMKTLPVPCPADHHLPAFSEWITRAFARLRRDYGPECGPLGARLVEQAERAFADIEALKQCDVLLHGDLHHANILFDDRRGWTAIDPKGVIGDPCLEVGRFMHNQLPNTLSLVEKQHRIEERVEILTSELGMSRERLLHASLVDMVLSLSWGLEGTSIADDWYEALSVAQIMSQMVDR